MGKKKCCVLGVVVCAFSLLYLTSCSKHQLQQDEMSNAEKEGAITGLSEDELEDAGEHEGAMQLSTIFFAFDDYSLSEPAKKALSRNAGWLTKNPQEEVTIEGHCDERGTEEYNIALGERRANSAKRYLLSLGVTPKQLSTLSFGEENPADPGHNEAAWEKNRRAEFVVK